MKIKRHIPNACDGLEASTIEFNTKSELLNIPFVLDFRMDPFGEDKENPYFKRYSIAKYTKGLFGDDIYLLIAEFNTDEIWKEAFWVVGYISKYPHEELDFPVWEAPDQCI
jgi:hypothetical protein